MIRTRPRARTTRPVRVRSAWAAAVVGLSCLLAVIGSMSPTAAVGRGWSVSADAGTGPGLIPGACAGTGYFQTATGSSGASLAAWTCAVGDPTSFPVQAATRTPDGVWSPPVEVAVAGQPEVHVGVDGGGAGVVAFMKASGTGKYVSVASIGGDGTLGSVQTISDPLGNTFAFGVAVNEAGAAVVTWTQLSGGSNATDPLYFAPFAATGTVSDGFSEAQQLDSFLPFSGRDEYVQPPVIDANGDAAVTWAYTTDEIGQTAYTVGKVSLSVAGAPFGPPESTPWDGRRGNTYLAPLLSLSDHGVTVAWLNRDTNFGYWYSVFSTSKTLDGHFGGVQELRTILSTDDRYPNAPSATNSSGLAVYVYSYPVGGSGINVRAVVVGDDGRLQDLQIGNAPVADENGLRLAGVTVTSVVMDGNGVATANWVASYVDDYHPESNHAVSTTASFPAMLPATDPPQAARSTSTQASPSLTQTAAGTAWPPPVVTAPTPSGSADLQLATSSLNDIMATWTGLSGGANVLFSGLLPTPQVSRVSPDAGKVDGGNVVTVTGAHFLKGSKVLFDGVVAQTTFVSSTQLRATAPAHPAGPVRLTVLAQGSNRPSDIAAYVYGKPEVVALDPEAGPSSGGNTVDIFGSGFTPGAAVLFGATASKAVTYVSRTQLRATVPAHAAGGVAVSVKTGAGISLKSAADLYAYGPPKVTGFTPSAAPTGKTVTVNGNGFTSSTTVRFGSVPAEDVKIVSSTKLTATVPDGALTGRISVTNPLGLASSTAAFKVTLSVAGFTPSGGDPGTVVFVSGVGFNAKSAVRFGDVAATQVTYRSPSSLVVVVPDGATTGAITVTNTTTPVGSVRSAAAFVVP